MILIFFISSVIFSVNCSVVKEEKGQVYCSGALFNPYERQNMADIAHALEENGFLTYLPHRDGLEKLIDLVIDKRKLFLSMSFLTKFRTLFDQALCALQNNCDDEELFSEAAYILDVYQIWTSEYFVLNMNGRVIDEGGAIEVGIAFTLGKKIVLYKDDYRTKIQGQDNSMVVGMIFPKFGAKHIAKSIDQIPKEFVKLDQDMESSEILFANLPKRFQHLIRVGEQIENLVVKCEHVPTRQEKIDVIREIIDLVRNKNDFLESTIDEL